MTTQQQAAWDAAILALADAQVELWGAYFRETDEFLREKMKAARTKCIEAGVMMREAKP